MAFELRMPKLGMTMDDGVVTRWLKQEGEPVAKGEPIAEITTEKIATEIESPGSGILRKVLVEAGQEVPVGSLLALIGTADEELQLPQEEAPHQLVEAVGAEAVSGATVATQATEDGLRASPVARKLAKEHGIDLSLVKPAQPGARISRDDVLAYIAAREAAEAEARDGGVSRPVEEAAASGVSTAPTAAKPPAGIARSLPMAGMRKMIADHLVASLHSAAQLSIAIEMDFTELVKARDSILPGFQLATGTRPTYTDILIVLVARALQQHPLLNSTMSDDAILLHDDVHMGVAVAIENGLIVPVIRDAHKKSLAEITLARSDLARRAAEGRLTPDEVVGGTFTITNPGLPGADISTPILKPPQNAILGVGRIVKKPVVRDDEICIRQLCWISLTFDHRAMDGMPAARFLDTLSSMLQEPLRFLVTG